MTNLVQRLREYNPYYAAHSYYDGTVDEAADVIEKLLSFVRDRVANRETMTKGGYHARRICLEAESLLKEIGEDK